MTQLSLLHPSAPPTVPTLRGYVKRLDSGGDFVVILAERTLHVIHEGPYEGYCEETLCDALYARLPVDVTVVDGKVDSVALAGKP